MSAETRASTITKQGRSGQTLPFDMSGVVRTGDGVLRYTTLRRRCWTCSGSRSIGTRTVSASSFSTVTASVSAVVGPLARVAGGLRAMGVQPGDRVANRHGNGIEWCLGFWGTLMAGAVVVPVNTRFSDSEVSYVVTDAGADVVLQPDPALPDGEPYVDSRRPARIPCRPDVHQRHDGIPEGRDGHPRELPVQHRDMRPSPAHPPDTAYPQPDLGPAVPRHWVQQPIPRPRFTSAAPR